VQREDIAFWPEIFLALRRKEHFKFTSIDKDTGYGVAHFDVEKIENSKSIEISRVDGNHRLHYADGKAEGFPPLTKIVSFCLAVETDVQMEIKLFRDINNNQRRMNTSHLDNIKLRLDSDEMIARRDPMLYIANRLKTDNGSPLAGVIYDGGASDVNKFIPLRTLKTGLEYMFSRPTRLTALEDINIQVIVVKNYFSALKKWQPGAWRHPKDYLLLRGAGLWGACFLGAEVIDRALAKGNFKVDDMLAVLKSGANWDWTRDGSFQGLSGRSGAVKIRDMVAAELEDDTGVSLKSVMRRIVEDR
jgi:DGQHR domain-containing protein